MVLLDMNISKQDGITYNNNLKFCNNIIEKDKL